MNKMRQWFNRIPVLKGGPGSGNWGHTGSPGRGGSPGMGGADAGEERATSFSSSDAASSWAAEGWKEWNSGLSGQEREVLRGYGGEGYEELNSYLRGGEEPDLFWGDATAGTLGRGQVDDILEGRISIEELADEYTDIMDKAIAKGSMPSGVMVYRGYGGAKLPGVVGSTFSDGAFVSTSLLESESLQFAERGGAFARIFVPKGTSAAYMGGYGPKNEVEILLPRNTTFKIIRFSKVGDVTIFDLEVVP